MGETCSSGCPRPPDPYYPWYARLTAVVLTYVTWPWCVRELKRAGARRIGWMTWEFPPLRAVENIEDSGPDCD